MNRIDLYNMDCRDAMSLFLPDNSVDAIVCDPPYGLAFMGKKWDYDVPGVDIWAECLRVLKPGGHLLAFAGARTQHRMAVRIEDAGFEIRDMIAWVYGSGFNKVGYIKDGGGQHVRKGWGGSLKPALEPITMARKPLIGTVVANVLAHGTGALNIDGCRVEGTPAPTRFDPAKHGREGWRMNATGAECAANASPLGRWPANLIHDGSEDVVAAFPQAKRQQGALTGSEPSSKTANTFGEFAGRASSAPRGDTGSAARFFYAAKASKKDRDEGLDDHETVIIERSLTLESPKWGNADRQVVLQVDTEPSPPKVIAVSGVSNKSAHEWSTLLFGSEHTAPCLQGTTCIIETPTSSTTGLTTLSYFQNLLTSANTQVANYETESGGSPAQTAAPGTLLLRTTSGLMASALGVEHAASPTLLKISVSARRSDHPTVKPTDLMAYLCRLVTPPGGVVFDPFMGSGSTGKAALREGFGFIGCEMDAAYFAIAEARLAAVKVAA